MNFFLIPCFITIFFLSREYDLIFLCIANLVVIFVIVTSQCYAIFQTGDDCGVGIGWVWAAAIFVIVGLAAAWGLYRGWRAGYTDFSRII